MKTQISGKEFELESASHFETGQVPFLLSQKNLISLTGETLRPGGLMITKKAVELCDFGSGDRVLDAGCGYGMTLRYLQETHKINVVGADSNPEVLGKAGLRNAENREKIPYTRSCLPHLPFKNKSFSGIFCECVFSLVPQKKECLEEFMRVLKQNGKLVLIDLYIPQRFAVRISSACRMTRQATCMDGALPILELIRTVEDAGFNIDIIEDHTDLLKQLAGEILYQQQAVEKNPWEKMGKGLCGNALSAPYGAGRLRPGYCMIIAGKYT